MNLKKFIAFITLFTLSVGYAQKIGYVDTQHILKQMPQYKQADDRLNEEIKRWQKEIETQQSNLEQMRTSFENEKVLLTDAQQRTKLATIDSVDKELKKYIDKKFGTNGESTSLRINLAKPVQDQIWNAINSVATREKYNMIFDKASTNLVMIYTDPRYDVTDKVIKQLGVNNAKEADSNSKSANNKATIKSKK